MEEELRVAWSLDVGRGAAADGARDELVARYREPHRRYHTVRHLASVLAGCTDLLRSITVPDPTAVRLAAWFHDAVYDPRAADNEAVSAILAQRVLGELDVAPERIEAVRRLVLATAVHEPTAEDEAVLIDADLAILAARPAVYNAYVTGVRAEYAHVDDDAWRAGRTAVLDSFLDRPAIFHTAPWRAQDAVARGNLAAERSTLIRP